jgi:GTP-binding protein HflX
LQYRLPRLRGKGTKLSQQAGGMSAGAARIGSRGPGETQLEVDRRRLVRRIHKLEGELKNIGKHRDTQRKSRRRSQLGHVAIVGYTNAGKSTLLNRLTDAGVVVEDRLFATLDATTRRLSLPGGEPVLVTDTVGFVRKLPHQLVEAFKSTLEVAGEADLLVQIVDSSVAEPEMQIDAVHSVLNEISGNDVPELLAFNKSDIAPENAARLAARYPGSVAISANNGDGVDELLRAIADRLRALTAVVELVVPYERGDVLAAIHREGEVVSETVGEGAMRLRVRFDEAARSRFREYVQP